MKLCCFLESFAADLHSGISVCSSTDVPPPCGWCPGLRGQRRCSSLCMCFYLQPSWSMGSHSWRGLGRRRWKLWILLLLFLVFHFGSLTFIFGCCISQAWVLELPIRPCSARLQVSTSAPGLSRSQFPARWRRRWRTIWMYLISMCHSACAASAGVLSRPGVPIQAAWYILGHLVELVRYYNSQPNSLWHWNA